MVMEVKERWRPIVGADGAYEVSDQGRVRNQKTLRVLSPVRDKLGYLRVTLSVNKKCKHKSIHRLVALAFVDNPNGYVEVNHIDEDKTNNRYTNLEWCTRLHNLTHGTARQRAAKSKSIPVIQYLDGIEIARFESIKKAGQMTGCDAGHICQCCRKNPKRSHVNGYTFSYA